MYDADNQLVSDPDCLFSMSAKDLQAARYIPALMDAGVSSLKIEGRMKTAYYVACVVKAYRRLIDTYETKGFVSEEDYAACIRELEKAENRPTSNGFYEGLPDANGHLYGTNGAGVIQDFVATVQSYDPLSQMAVIQVRNHFVAGTRLEVMSPTIDNETFVAGTLYTMDGMVQEVANKPMQLLRVKIPFEVQKDDFIRKVSEENVCG